MIRRQARLSSVAKIMRRAAQQPPRCPTRKIPYLSRDEAGQALRDRRRRGGFNTDELTTYKCPHCQKWHLGHTDIGPAP